VLMMSESSWLISAWKAKVSVSEAMAPDLLEHARVRVRSTRCAGAGEKKTVLLGLGFGSGFFSGCEMGGLRASAYIVGSGVLERSTGCRKRETTGGWGRVDESSGAARPTCQLVCVFRKVLELGVSSF
jgi:hypothetical protein